VIPLVVPSKTLVGVPRQPETKVGKLRCWVVRAFSCFPAFAGEAREAENTSNGVDQAFRPYDESGAGEGIRTLDFNLGKVGRSK
jgi:hypothetical protein